MPPLKRQRSPELDAEHHATSKRQHSDEDITLLAGPDKIEFKVPLAILKHSSPYFTGKFSGQWQDSDDLHVSMPDVDPDIVRIVIEILEWKRPYIANGCQAGKLAICADYYQLSPVKEYIELYLQDGFDKNSCLKNGSDYLGILVAALHSRDEKMFARMTGHLVYLVPFSAFSKFFAEDDPGHIWDQIMDANLLRFTWEALRARAARLLDVFVRSAIEAMSQANASKLQELSDGLKALLSEDPHQRSIRDVLRTLQNCGTTSLYIHLSEMQFKLEAGKAGFRTALDEKGLTCHDLDKAFLKSTTEVTTFSVLTRVSKLNVQACRLQASICREGSRLTTPKWTHSRTAALQDAATQLEAAVRAYEALEEQMEVENQVRTLSSDLKDRLKDWFAKFVPYDLETVQVEEERDLAPLLGL